GSTATPYDSVYLYGDTIYIRVTADSRFQLQNTFSVALHDALPFFFPALGGTVGSWTHTAQTVNAPAGGPYTTTNNFAWSAGEANSPTETVTSTGTAGNSSNTSVLTFANDSTNPTGSITAPAANENV